MFFFLNGTILCISFSRLLFSLNIKFSEIVHVLTCRTRSSTRLSKATHGHSLSHTIYSRLLLNFAAMHLIVMSPCHRVSFEYLPKSGSAWPQGVGISHLDIARLLFQVIHQLTNSPALSPSDPFQERGHFPAGGGMFQYGDIQRW